MAMTLELCFQGVERTPTLEGRIGEKAAKLSALYQDLTHCRVTVSAPHRHHKNGGLFEVHIDAHYPGGEAAVSRSHRHDEAHADPAVAIRDAFAALGQRLRHLRGH